MTAIDTWGKAEIPTILYKYKPLDKEGYTMKILTDGEIYFPSISKLNDPFEGDIPYIFDTNELTSDNIFLAMRKIAKESNPEMTEEELHEYLFEEQKQNLLFDINHLEDQRKKTKEIVDRLFGIYSLTNNNNNFLMWSYYANSHKGICIGFNSEKLFKITEGTIGAVTYSENLPQMQLSDINKAYSFYERLISTKSSDWQHEKEYRLTKIGLANKIIKVPLNTIKEIIFGCKTEFDQKRDIVEFIKANNKDCKIFEASMSKSKFKLDITRIF